MPVIMNEPMSGIQRVSDWILSIDDQLRIAANTDNSLKRLARTCGAIYSMNHQATLRKKKNFNPMLGESYEMVTEKFRYLAEKTAHNPDQLSCMLLESDDFILKGNNDPKTYFGLNGGKG